MDLELFKKGTEMNYKNIFSVSTIIPNLEATTKYEVITSLVDILKEKKKIEDRDEVLNEVIRRESLASTGFENGLAIPHAVVKSLDKIVTSIARIPNGIDFISQDKKPTFFVILICYPPNLQLVYLNLLSGISKLFMNKENIELLLKQKTGKDIHKTLIKLLELNDKICKEAETDDIGLKDLPKATDKPIYLLIKLQMYEGETRSSGKKKKEFQETIKNIRALIPPEILNFYDRLSKHKFPPVVPIEGNVCKGCNTTVPNEFLSQLVLNREKINYCPNCRRIVYLI